MSEQAKNKDDQRDKGLAAAERPIPSQAEGEDAAAGVDAGKRPVPSQAEGDRETVEADLNRSKAQR
jgi:hypothetical protein